MKIEKLKKETEELKEKEIAKSKKEVEIEKERLRKLDDDLQKMFAQNTGNLRTENRTVSAAADTSDK